MVFAFPKRRGTRIKMKLRLNGAVVWPSHLKWVRGHECLCAGRSGHLCEGKMEAHHAKLRSQGGGDDTAVPLCTSAHAEYHDKGSKSFYARYGIGRDEMQHVGKLMWQRSPHRIKYEKAMAIGRV